MEKTFHLIALSITEDKQKRALLLYQAGQATQEIFETLTETDYKTALAKLNEYFLPKRMLIMKHFRSDKQLKKVMKLLISLLLVYAS